MDLQDYFNINQKLWDKRTGVHVKSDFYKTDAVIAGESSLTEIENFYLPDVSGKSLLHLQCHFGLDTISLARKGAKCTGLDFSSEAIQLARQLSEKAKVDVQFVEANVYDLPKLNLGLFDMVFISYGTIGWLPDLDRWASGISNSLKSGGQFYFAEFHPCLYMFEFNTGQLDYSYFNTGEAIEEWCESSYTGTDDKVSMPSWFWQHSIEETVNALIKHGLQIESFHEVPWSPYNCFPNMKEIQSGRYYYGPEKARIPHVLVINARKI
ncbi:MAG: class I SAM-dependent methyltransferase [Saprospiraceae bacterium]|nr:class I SAM-dependent methyltransferase [Saprospiraceae bacterium]MBK7810465.1 class I SAM-dependent methyltransferase [Saprospiraceae bacterium]MBK9630057.1 class I SAM-dependent methyltransferase [Saprospiraceae bacterium]